MTVFHRSFLSDHKNVFANRCWHFEIERDISASLVNIKDMSMFRKCQVSRDFVDTAHQKITANKEF